MHSHSGRPSPSRRAMNPRNPGLSIPPPPHPIPRTMRCPPRGLGQKLIGTSGSSDQPAAGGRSTRREAPPLGGGATAGEGQWASPHKLHPRTHTLGQKKPNPGPQPPPRPPPCTLPPTLPPQPSGKLSFFSLSLAPGLATPCLPPSISGFGSLQCLFPISLSLSHSHICSSLLAPHRPPPPTLPSLSHSGFSCPFISPFLELTPLKLPVP